MKKIILSLFIVGISISVFAQQTGYETIRNIHYYSEAVNQADPYTSERCVLDIYYPKDLKNYPTIVWFHGGGLTGGNKEIPAALMDKGVAVVAVNYRLYPKVKAPSYIEDAAAAVSWVFKNIKSYGGDPALIIVSGHSAGGYLAMMVGLDKSWLSTYGIDANSIAALVPFSGQAITHFIIRKEKGMPDTQPMVDKMAPLYHVRADAPPMLLITGDRELEMLGRYEENAYIMRMMKVAGHQKTRLLELDGYGHSEMAYPGFPLLIDEVKRIVRDKK
ncbi:MAG TPA: alpha/beta hydrolase [Prolixibacteraceae bacterium]|nr:alpha/beta hydrolase [Prolixibacteraceae bacterium]